MEIDVTMLPDREPKSQQDSTEFITRDLGLATFLSLDHSLLGVQRDGPNLIAFQFMDDARLRSDVDDYFALRGSVQPLRFATALRGLKNVLHQAMQLPRPAETALAPACPSSVETVSGTPTVRRRRPTS